MSSVSIQPNSGGTGVFTIAAPSTSSNYTLSLPTVTGGSFIASDGSGNVGIGGGVPASNPKVSLYGGIRFLANEAATATYTGIGSIATDTVSISTSGYERMRVDTGGNFLLNTTSVGGRFSMRYDSSVEQGLVIRTTSATFSGSPVVFQNNSGGTSGFIGQTATTVSYSTSSDYRLKEDIVPMTSVLEKVAALKPVTYKWKVDGSAGEGFIAHELAEVCPQAVTGEKDAVDADGNPQYQGIDVSFLVATLTAAIQEQQAIITSLTSRVAALEEKKV